MTSQIALITIMFASVSAGLAAAGFFLRDLFVKPKPAARQRLE